MVYHVHGQLKQVCFSWSKDDQKSIENNLKNGRLKTHIMDNGIKKCAEYWVRIWLWLYNMGKRVGKVQRLSTWIYVISWTNVTSVFIFFNKTPLKRHHNPNFHEYLKNKIVTEINLYFYHVRKCALVDWKLVKFTECYCRIWVKELRKSIYCLHQFT